MKTETLPDVPLAKLEAFSNQFVVAGARVVAILQLDGLWTIVATFETPKP